MKNSKRDFGTVGQNSVEVKKSQKHDANLQKNSTLYFQIGLILCLLGTYALFEMQFEKSTLKLSDDDQAMVETISMEYVEPFEVEVIKPKDPEPIPTTELNDIYKEVEDDTPIIETVIKTPEEPVVSDKPAAKVEDFKPIEKPDDENILVPFVLIEKAPVYPGCEKYTKNDDLKKCLSDKITKLIGKKFNTEIGDNYGIYGKQKITTQFTIDKNGNVSDIKVRGPHKALEDEAKRVINKIPKMQPGLQRNEPVGVIYTLPITYQTRN